MDPVRPSTLLVLLGVALLLNPLYVGAAVPDPTYEYEVHRIEPARLSEPGTVASLGFLTQDRTYRGPTVELVFDQENRSLAVLREARDGGYTAPADDVPRRVARFTDDGFVASEVTGDDRWRLYRTTATETDGTLRLTADRVSPRTVVDALAVPVADAPPRVRRLVRDGEVDTRQPIRSVVFVDDGTYYRLDRDGARAYEGPLRLLPEALGVAGWALVIGGLVRRGPSPGSVVSKRSGRAGGRRRR